jgi:hypothetical protein
LDFGAFDFLVRAGAPVFLEVNPGGDWQWIEASAGVAAVTTAVTRMLRDRHLERPVPDSAAPARATHRLDLLRFLAGSSPAEPSRPPPGHG